MTTYWACALTKLNAEALALRNLRRQRYKAFYPFFLVPNRFGRLVVKPVFANYVFIELDALANWSPINSTLGVKRLLTQTSRGSEYRIPARAQFVDDMRKLRSEVHRASLLPVGATVRITRGPFAERVALVEMSDEARVRLLLEVFSRQVAIDFALDDVRLVRRDAGDAAAPDL